MITVFTKAILKFYDSLRPFIFLPFTFPFYVLSFYTYMKPLRHFTKQFKHFCTIIVIAPPVRLGYPLPHKAGLLPTANLDHVGYLQPMDLPVLLLLHQPLWDSSSPACFRAAYLRPAKTEGKLPTGLPASNSVDTYCSKTLLY